MIPRDFQQEDFNAVIAAHEAGKQAVLLRAATGLGKGLVIAMLNKHYSQFGRVVTLVDVEKLVWQLSGTVKAYTGSAPGIEMGEHEALNNTLLDCHDRMVVGTVQSQYSGKPGRERYRRFSPEETSCLLLDECETFLAEKAAQVVEWYRQNPKLKIVGLSATPFRTDGKGMGRIFDHACNDLGPLNRDLLWGRDQGWLVPAMQGFVRVSVDFSDLKLSKNADGEKDYSDAEIAEKMMAEEPLIELAKGIIHEAGDRRALIVCPKVEVAVAVRDYLEAERAGCCKAIYGELSDEEKTDIFEGHQKGQFQFLSSVMMLTKGYDDPVASVVFVCRKTKSKRLYQQIAGRVVRPLAGIVDGKVTSEERKQAIAGSAKPNALVVNMVGIDDATRDITLVDLLAERESEDMRRRAKKKQDAGEENPELALADAKAEIEAERKAAEEREAKRRKLKEVKATVQSEYTDEWRAGGGSFGGQTSNQAWGQEIARGIPERQVTVFVQNKVPTRVVANLTLEAASALSQKIIARHKAKLCTYAQAARLREKGVPQHVTAILSKVEASEVIGKIADNHWCAPPGLIEALKQKYPRPMAG